MRRISSCDFCPAEVRRQAPPGVVVNCKGNEGAKDTQRDSPGIIIKGHIGVKSTLRISGVLLSA